MLLLPALVGLCECTCLDKRLHHDRHENHWCHDTSAVGSLSIYRLVVAAQHGHGCKSYYDFAYFLLLQDYCEQQGLAVKSAVDAACAAGLSTRSLADRFPGAKVQGLDLSPHFLALAQLRRR